MSDEADVPVYQFWVFFCERLSSLDQKIELGRGRIPVFMISNYA